MIGRMAAYRSEFTGKEVARAIGSRTSGTARYDHDAWYRPADLVAPEEGVVGETCELEGMGEGEPLPPFVDREALLSLSDDLDGAARDAGDVGPVAEVFHDIARSIREACGEVVE